MQSVNISPYHRGSIRSTWRRKFVCVCARVREKWEKRHNLKVIATKKLSKYQISLVMNKISICRGNPIICDEEAARYPEKGVPRMLLSMERTPNKVCGFWKRLLWRRLNVKLLCVVHCFLLHKSRYFLINTWNMFNIS